METTVTLTPTAEKDVLVQRLHSLAEELDLVKARLLTAGGDDRHLRAAAHRLDDAAYACARVLDELEPASADLGRLVPPLHG